MIEPAEGPAYPILKGTATLKAGDRFRLRVGGGGGFGPPIGRDPELVAADVAAGYISIDHAAEIYGVIATMDGILDNA